MGKEREALNDLVEGVSLYEEDQKFTAFSLITDRLQKAYDKILNLLLSNYNLSEQDALDIAHEQDNYVYTLRIEAVVNGQEYIDPNTEEGQKYYDSLYDAAYKEELEGQAEEEQPAPEQTQPVELPDKLPPEEEMEDSDSNT
jgi:hypothetical protein